MARRAAGCAASGGNGRCRPFLSWALAGTAQRRRRDCPRRVAAIRSGWLRQPLRNLRIDQLTNSLRFLSAAIRTFLLAGLALNIIFSPLKGFTPSRALVAGFLTTFILSRPGMVNKPWLRKL